MLKYDSETKIMSMTVGDFGMGLPLTLTGVTISDADTITFTIKKPLDDTIVLEKVFTNIVDNKFELSFTEEESKLLPVGTYLYSMDWFRQSVFMNNLRKKEFFNVEDK